MPKNFFDQFDEKPQTPPQSSAPAAQGGNFFDQFDNHDAEQPPAQSAEDSDPQIMPHDAYLKELHTRLQDKGQSLQSIMDWSAQAGHRITSPKALRINMLDVRGGKLHPDNVNVTFDDTGMAHPQGPSSGAIGAFLRNAGEGASLDWGDELGENIGAAIGPVRGAIDSAIGRGVLPSDDPNKTFEERRDYLRAQDQAQAESDQKEHPYMSDAGYVTGIVGSSIVPVGEAVNGARAIKILSGGGKVGKVLRGATAGAGIAATDAAGAAEPGSRETAAVEAAPVGAVVGVAAPVVVGAGGRVLKGIANRTGATDAIDALAGKVNGWARRLGITDPEVWQRIPADIKALAQRARVNPDQIKQMKDAVETYRRAGVEPRVLDVITPTQQDAVGSIIRKDQGAGRDAAYAAAENEANNFGSEVKRQFDRVTNVGSEGLDDTAERIGQRQDYRASEVMDQLRDRPLPIDPDTVNVLNTRVGRQALNEATKAADPATREAMQRLPELMSQLHSLGPDARAQILKQMDNPFTVGMADRIRIALNDAAQSAYKSGKGGLAREIRGLRDTVRTAAGRSDAQYSDYLKNYGEDAKTQEAIGLGREAMDRNTDEFVPKAEALSDEPNAVLNANDMKASRGVYHIDSDGHGVDPQSGNHEIRVTRELPNGDEVNFRLTVPQNKPRHLQGGKVPDLGVISVDSVQDGQRMSYGNSEGFNNVGPAELRDAMRWFRENYADRFPHIRGFVGDRVGGAREVAQNERFGQQLADQGEAERRAGVTRQYDELPPDAREVPVAGYTDEQTYRTNPDGVQTTADGNSFEALQANYRHAVDQNDYEGSFHSWLNDMYHPEEVPPSFWERARNEGGSSESGIMGDESGSKRLPSGQSAIDYINGRREAPPQPSRAATGPQGSGVTNNGVDTRVRNERPSDLPQAQSFHRAKPAEVLTDSDRQLATAAMSRDIERRTGEGVRGAFETGRRLAYAPEQQKRSAALLGDSVAAEVQRAMDASMRKAKNTARVAPSTGSPTAIREGDDSVTQMMNVFGHAATGNKIGMVRSIAHVFANVGITPTQSKNLITKVLDPAQTDKAIEQLSKYVGKDGAMEMIRHLRRLAAQTAGNQQAQNQ